VKKSSAKEKDGLFFCVHANTKEVKSGTRTAFMESQHDPGTYAEIDANELRTSRSRCATRGTYQCCSALAVSGNWHDRDMANLEVIAVRFQADGSRSDHPIFPGGEQRTQGGRHQVSEENKVD
jgi:hypothetical protein